MVKGMTIRDRYDIMLASLTRVQLLIWAIDMRRRKKAADMLRRTAIRLDEFSQADACVLWPPTDGYRSY